MSENRKCWYCGSEPMVWHDDVNLFAECPNEDCPNYGDNGFEALVLSVWNTRPIEDALQKRIDELEAQLVCMKKYYHKPTHSPCCTCQNCGQHYDDCRCNLDDVADENTSLRLRITELQSSVSDLESQLRWIPVSERLPEEQECYEVKLDRVRYGQRYEYLWYYESGWDWVSKQSDVTHWRPLPEPPEVQP